MSDQIRTIKDSILSEIALELGASYKELAYLEDIEKNSFLTSNDRYGCRALVANQTPGVTKYTTLVQSFEIVISKGYIQSSVGDSEQVIKSYDIRANILSIYNRLVRNQAGSPVVVMNVNGLVVSEPEYLEDDKVVVVRATMDITHRINL